MDKIKSIYVAAPWLRKTEAKEARKKLEEAGFTVTSGWVDIPDDEDRDEAYMREQALNDYSDVFAAQALVLLNLEKSEGKAVETGLALATNMPILLVGERTNIFHWLPEVNIVGSVEEAIIYLQNYGV